MTTDEKIAGFGCSLEEEMGFQAEEFVYLPSIDQVNFDIGFKSDDVNEMTRMAFDCNACVGFNTFGFFKGRINSFSRPDCMRQDRGFYVKRSVLERIADGTILLDPESCLSRDDVVNVLKKPIMLRSFHHPKE